MNNAMHEKFKWLNKKILRDEHIDKDCNEYLYASLSQPPIKIINKNNSNDELNFTVECPNCHSHVLYGEQTYMMHGHIYCDSQNCKERLTTKMNYRKDI